MGLSHDVLCTTTECVRHPASHHFCAAGSTSEASTKAKHKLQKMRRLASHSSSPAAAAAAAGAPGTAGTAGSITVIIEVEELQEDDEGGADPEQSSRDAPGSEDASRVLSQYYASTSKGGPGQGQRLKPSRLNNSGGSSLAGAPGQAAGAGFGAEHYSNDWPAGSERERDREQQSVRFSPGSTTLGAGPAGSGAGRHAETLPGRAHSGKDLGSNGGAASSSGAGSAGAGTGMARTSSAKARAAANDATWVPIWERTNYAPAGNAGGFTLQRSDSSNGGPGSRDAAPRLLQALAVKTVDPSSFGLPGLGQSASAGQAGRLAAGPSGNSAAASSGAGAAGRKPWTGGVGGGATQVSSWTGRVLANAVRQAGR